MAAMKADLLRNFGHGPPAKSPTILASSAERPASPRTVSVAIEEDLPPRSPLIDASSQPDPAPFRRPSFHMQDLLSLDPVGFTPNEEISLINSAFPVMPTAVEEKEEAMRVRAEEAKFQEEGNGETSQSQVSYRLPVSASSDYSAREPWADSSEDIRGTATPPIYIQQHVGLAIVRVDDG